MEEVRLNFEETEERIGTCKRHHRSHHFKPSGKCVLQGKVQEGTIRLTVAHLTESMDMDTTAECVLNASSMHSAAVKKVQGLQNRRMLYILREGELFPIMLALPTSSLKEFSQYAASAF